MTKNLSTRLKRYRLSVTNLPYGKVHMTKNLSTRLKPEEIKRTVGEFVSSYDKESLYEIKTIQ